MSASELFNQMSSAIAEIGPSLVAKIKGVIKFVVPNQGEWIVDLKNGSGSVKKGPSNESVDLTITVSNDDFVALINNNLNPQQAFMKGKIKAKGNMGLAMKLNSVITATRDYVEKKGKSSPETAQTTAPTSTSTSLKSAEFFKRIEVAVKEKGSEFVKKVGGVIQFEITPGGSWSLDLKNGNGNLIEGKRPSDITITVSDDIFFDMATGKMTAQQAFMKGKLKVKGNMGLAMKLNVVMDAAKPKAKL